MVPEVAATLILLQFLYIKKLLNMKLFNVEMSNKSKNLFYKIEST